MKEVTKRATVETAYGETLANPVKFSYTFNELERGDEIPTDKMPDADAIRSFVNQRENAAARSKAQNEALSAAGIQKPTLEDPAVQLATIVKALKASGKSQEQAEQMAKSLLG
jgi:hypothetical protein